MQRLARVLPPRENSECRCGGSEGVSRGKGISGKQQIALKGRIFNHTDTVKNKRKPNLARLTGGVKASDVARGFIYKITLNGFAMDCAAAASS